jgi:hypothetical protein
LVLCVHGSKIFSKNWAWWLIPIIPATWETKIYRIAVQGQPGHKVSETPPFQYISGV